MLKIEAAQMLTIDREHVVCREVQVGRGTVIWNFVNLYECIIGEDCKVGAFVEITRGVSIGNRCRIQSHTFICDRVTVGNDCFIGHGVMFTNDTFRHGRPAESSDLWEETVVENQVSIGSNAAILPVRIGRGSVIGAGSIVTRDVPPWSVVAGNPAEVIRQLEPRP